MNEPRTADYALGVFVNAMAARIAADMDIPLLALIVMFALLGSLMRMFYFWEPQALFIQRLGTVGGSVFGAILVGLASCTYLRDSPTVLLTLTSSVSWLGPRIIDGLATRFLQGGDK